MNDAICWANPTYCLNLNLGKDRRPPRAGGGGGGGGGFCGILAFTFKYSPGSKSIMWMLNPYSEVAGRSFLRAKTSPGTGRTGLSDVLPDRNLVFFCTEECW